MQSRIRHHRNKMGFKNSKIIVETKVKEECMELYNELENPTTDNNLRKEIADTLITISALCDNRGWGLEEVLEYGILRNLRN